MFPIQHISTDEVMWRVPYSAKLQPGDIIDTQTQKWGRIKILGKLYRVLPTQELDDIAYIGQPRQ